MICIIEIENPVREIVKYIIESPRIQIIAIENRIGYRKGWTYEI